mmetsp:Transcript_152705/g.489811  ORF Transcript_152705/g.489811 Transcript_152705/m.489811 type:complete len:237 (+) Transcript_152705:791-1501(+)
MGQNGTRQGGGRDRCAIEKVRELGVSVGICRVQATLRQLHEPPLLLSSGEPHPCMRGERVNVCRANTAAFPDVDPAQQFGQRLHASTWRLVKQARHQRDTTTHVVCKSGVRMWHRSGTIAFLPLQLLRRIILPSRQVQAVPIDRRRRARAPARFALAQDPKRLAAGHTRHGCAQKVGVACESGVLLVLPRQGPWVVPPILRPRQAPVRGGPAEVNSAAGGDGEGLALQGMGQVLAP